MTLSLPKALQKASGDNTNPLLQPYKMPAPLVVDVSKTPSTTLPKTYVYDIPTKEGQEIELIGSTTGI